MKNRAAKTALGPMAQVALEQLVPKEQRVIHDTVAYKFLPAFFKGLINLCRLNIIRQALINLADKRAPGIRGGLLCRKRYIDEKLVEAINKGIKTVVILGSGFDSRAYRLSGLSSGRVYEVDLPENIQSKAKLLTKLFGEVPPFVTLVPIDFNNQKLKEVLLQAGYSFDQPTFFIWEGVTQYITETAVNSVFEFLAKAKLESRLTFTYIRKDFINGKKMYGLDLLYKKVRDKTQMWQFGLDLKQ